MKKVSVNIAREKEVTAIKVGQIILDDSHYLTCWGYLETADGWRKCDFVTNYDVLNTMLRVIEDKSEAVQMAIVQKLENIGAEPEMIDFEAQLGEAVLFDNLRFYLTSPHFDGDHSWEDYTGDSCFYIRKAEPCTRQEAYQHKVDQCMQALGKHYELYLGYLELDFDEESARRHADLGDDMKFTLAYHAWKQLPAR